MAVALAGSVAKLLPARWRSVDVQDRGSNVGPPQDLLSAGHWQPGAGPAGSITAARVLCEVFGGQTCARGQGWAGAGNGFHKFSTVAFQACQHDGHDHGPLW